MDNFFVIFKIISLFFSVWFTSVVILRAWKTQNVSWPTFAVMSFSMTMFIYAMGWLA